MPPEKRWLLVPPILTRILQTDHATSNPEERQAEVSLIQTCTTFFKQAYMHTLSLKNQPMPPPHPSRSAAGPAPTSQQEFFVRFVKHLLHHFRQCVKSVLVTFMEKNQLRKVLLIDEDLDRTGAWEEEDKDDHQKKKKSKNYRLGLFQAIIAAGDQLAELASPSSSGESESAQNDADSDDKFPSCLATADDWRQIKDTFLTMIDSN